MTHEEIEAAIERLQTFACDTVTSVIINLIGSKEWYYSDDWCAKDLRDTLVALLRQADPDTHMELPVDADGVPIHVGEELCGHYYPDGGVYCVSINGSEAIFVSKIGEHYRDAMLWKPSECRHYHMPTVEDLLREFGTKYFPHPEMQEKILAEYAAKLLEVVNDD